MEQSIVTPELTAMALADTAKQTVTLEQRVASMQQIVDRAFEANDYSKLAIASQLMLKLKDEQARSVAAKLEAKLMSELDVLEAYELELAPYNELRCFISEGTIKSVVLLNVVAQKTTKAPSSAVVAKSGLPRSAILLETHGSCLHAENVTYNDLFATARQSKDRKNAVYDARELLLKHCQTHKQ